MKTLYRFIVVILLADIAYNAEMARSDFERQYPASLGADAGAPHP